jgi:hypothetical protein
MKLETVPSLARQWPAVSEHKLRWWIRNRQTNGLQKSGAAVKKVGRWYLNPEKLERWIEEGD